MAVNNVILQGNFVRDPVFRVSKLGTEMCEFSVASTRKFKDARGNLCDETSFVEVIAWGKQAGLISRYFAKGSPIILEGRLKQESWTDKLGQKRSRLRVVMEAFHYVGGKQGRDEVPAMETPEKSDAIPVEPDGTDTYF